MIEKDANNNNRIYNQKTEQQRQITMDQAMMNKRIFTSFFLSLLLFTSWNGSEKDIRNKHKRETFSINKHTSSITKKRLLLNQKPFHK